MTGAPTYHDHPHVAAVFDAVPRDIDPAVRGIRNVHCYDIDDLERVRDANLAQRVAEVKKVEEIIEGHLASLGACPSNGSRRQAFGPPPVTSRLGVAPASAYGAEYAFGLAP